jgi:hypothetical protein
LSGTSAPLKTEGPAIPGMAAVSDPTDELYPPLRQLPRLAVPYSDLYRRVRVQEAVFDILTQQYEVAQIQEAKDVPVIGVIDVPGIPEKKSFPPRLLLTILITAFALAASASYILMHHYWRRVSASDPRRLLAQRISADLHRQLERYAMRKEGAR